jgi:hypothetical protein
LAPAIQRHSLHATAAWLLNLPDDAQLDASALFRTPTGDLLTVNDKQPGLHRIRFRPGTNAADLVRLPDCFTDEQLAPFTPEKVGRYDCEGIARDDQGRLYVCEEANRWILRWDPRTKRVERLDIDWTPVKPYFHETDPNASFEGIAIGKGKLYVANERQVGRILVVDLATLRVEADFAVKPAGSDAQDVHYTDLCWFGDELWVLLRDHRYVLRVDPSSHRVLAQFHYGPLEYAGDHTYDTRLPTGLMEGLSVDGESIWLLTDNNGRGRARDPADTRPTLFQCPRPDRGPAGSKPQP